MRVVVSEFLSLDGVAQAPGGQEEDPSGGFAHGGWSIPYFDPEVMGAVVDTTARDSEVLLQGARTYRVSAAAWPERSGSGDAFTDWINAARKYVVSDQLREEEITWNPTTIVPRDRLVETVRELRERPGGDVYVYGSLTVVRALLAEGLVDELNLFLEPVLLGGGKRLFPEDGQLRRLELISAQVAGTGVIVARYRPAGSEQADADARGEGAS